MSGKASPTTTKAPTLSDEERKVGGTGQTTPHDESPKYELQHSNPAHIDPDELHAAGVKRIEAISAHLKPWERGVVFAACFLIAYVYGLDGTIRYTYQSYATASYSLHSLLATINVLRSVIGAVGQPTAAKIADVFGRAELVCVSVVFYIIGTIVEATSTWVTGFSAGAVLYQVGYTMIILLIEVIIADLTSLRSRLFFSFVPALPFVINTWVSGDITAAVLASSTWNWGIGMWAIIYPVCTIPLLSILFIAQRRASRAGELEAYKTPFQTLGWRLPEHLFWSLDVIGIVLMIAAFALFLVPFTLAGGSTTTWSKAHIIAPLVIGILCFPVFIYWESRCRYPLVPFKLLKDRGVWAGFGIAVFLNCSWYMQYDYLYPVLVVALNQSIKSATRITALYSFASVITGTLCGLVVIRVRQLKPFIMFGVCVFAVAMGLLIRYRGGSLNDVSGVIGAQVLLGIGAGFFSYPTQASVQARTKHEHVAVITGLYLASYYIGSALGSTISGAIWTQTMPGQLEARIGQYNATLPALVYGDPYTYAPIYPLGSDVRTGIIEAYAHVQKIMCGVGLAFCLPLIIFSVLLRNPELGKEQSLPDAEEESVSDTDSRRFRLWK